MERWDRLCPEGYRFVYDDALFPPGTDSFLLSAFPKLKPGLRICALGCGTGLLGLLLLQRQPAAAVTGVELLPQAAALAERTAAANGLETRFTVLTGDLRQIRSLLPSAAFDLVVCNPPLLLRQLRASAAVPYPANRPDGTGLHPGGGLRCGGVPAALGRAAVPGPQAGAAGGPVLRPAGGGAGTQAPAAVCPRAGEAPSLVLAVGRRGGRPGGEILPPLVRRGPDGAPTAELDSIYFRTQEETP
jgi:tRNA1(Val) A37 N6-methylase TrmN6